MPYLVLIRHGESIYNKENRFTGILDIPLSPMGEAQAKKASLMLSNYAFDQVFTSSLKRAKDTASIIVKNVPFTHDKALDERDYGSLTGQNKDEAKRQYGENQVQIWRRSFDKAPPNGESLKDTLNRVIPYYQKEIEPLLLKGKNILVCAHGNSLRALLKYIEKISDEDILNIEVPLCEPIIYTFKQDEKDGKNYVKLLLPTHSN